MDPDAALAAARQARAVLDADPADLDDGWTDMEQEARDDAAVDLRDAFVALDEWCSKGGFLPAAWAAGRTVFVATVDTRYEVMAVAATEDEAVRLASEHAYQWLQARGALGREDTPAMVADYFGVRVTAVTVGTAVFVGNE